MAPQHPPDANGGDGSPQGSWREWARHVLIELERANAFIEAAPGRFQDLRTDFEARLSTLREEHRKEISGLWMEIVSLKLKSGMWGAVGALIPILIALVVYYATKHAG